MSQLATVAKEDDLSRQEGRLQAERAACLVVVEAPVKKIEESGVPHESSVFFDRGNSIGGKRARAHVDDAAPSTATLNSSTFCDMGSD